MKQQGSARMSAQHPARRWAVVVPAVAASLIVAGPPAQAAAPGTPDGPRATSVRSDAAATLRAQVRATRAVYRAEVKVARAQYELAITPARSARRLALAQAEDEADRRAARSDFADAQHAAALVLESAITAAAAKRDAAIDSALADYLLATGKASVLAALQTYRNDAKLASATLELALGSARAAFKTDTSDERSALSEAIGSATTGAEQALAWAHYEAATRDEQAAYQESVTSARTTYRSALKKARAQFRLSTGMSIRRLDQLPFRV